MPPRIRRETPARRDARIRKHLAQAREYWRQAPLELAPGDICQAGEKGWGTVAQLAKAVATHRGWYHYDQVAIQEAITALIEEMPAAAETIDEGLSAAERLHGNFYEVYMTPARAQFALQQIRPLLEILWDLLPDDYTPAPTFAQWTAAAQPGATGMMPHGAR